MLLAYLTNQRNHVLANVEGLSEEDLKRQVLLPGSPSTVYDGEKVSARGV